MHITLIHPPQFVAFSNQVSTIAMPPLGLAYLAGSLREAGHEVAMVDGFGEGLDRIEPFGSVYLRGLANEEILSRIPRATRMIGVGCMFSSQWLSVRALLGRIKEAFPHVPLVLGGEHATGLPELSFAQAPVDIVVQGEGEETLIELADRIQRSHPLADTAGIAYRNGSGIVRNPRRRRMRNVDDIPLPAWDLIRLEGYQEASAPHGVSRGRFMPMLATRGCPFQCTFCTSAQMWTQLWIPRDPKKVVDEMELYVRRYRATDFQFEDLTAIVRKEWIIAFCRQILERNLKLTFQLPSGTRSEALDKEAVAWMKRAGCHEFAFAPESGDEETLRIIKKQVNLQRLFASARDALDAGIHVGCFFIVGFPHERWRHILRTYQTIARCAVMGIRTVSVNVFSPQPSTRLFEELQREGRITLDDAYLWSLFEFPAFGRKKRSFNPRFSDAAITAVSIGGFFIFFAIRFGLRPHLVIKTIWEIFARTSENRLGKYVRSIRIEFMRTLKYKARARESLGKT